MSQTKQCKTSLTPWEASEGAAACSARPPHHLATGDGGRSQPPKEARAGAQSTQSSFPQHPAPAQDLEVPLVFPRSLARSMIAPGDHTRALLMAASCSEVMLHPQLLPSAPARLALACSSREEGRSLKPLFPRDLLSCRET